MNPIIYLIVLVLVATPIYLYLTWKQAREEKEKEAWLQSLRPTTLRIDVPRNNEKAPLAAEQMFASIHGIYSEKAMLQYHLSFEIVAKNKFIQFYVHLPKELKDFVEGQIYAQYPNVEILEVLDYVKEYEPKSLNYAAAELSMTKPDAYPIKLFSDFEVDPISGITSVMSNLAPGEEVWLQAVIRPVGDEWQDRGNSIISAVRSGKKSGGGELFNKTLGNTSRFLQMVLWQTMKPGTEMPEAKPAEVKLPGTVEDALKAIEYKIMKLGFETNLRVLSLANDPVTAQVKCQNVAAAFKQYNTTNLNGFKVGEINVNSPVRWQQYAERVFVSPGNVLNISELASIFHFPHQSVSTPNIVWSGSKKAEPPADLPTPENTSADELTVIGQTNFRNQFKKFGIRKDDRRRHVYIIGKSGVGKSTLIENMAVDDIVEGRGVIVVDPHGDLADKVLSCVPDDRVSDVVVFDPADRSYPIAFNLLEHVDDDFKGMVASGFVGIFKKIFGDSWGPRLEHILRNTVLALLDFPDSTMLDIPKMLTDNRFRERVVDKVRDPVIKDFWVNEFAQYDSKFRTEAVSPILNKVGQFLASSTIRNIVGQPHSRIDIREIMDQGKIMVVNLSRGKIGEDNSALLGAMMITKIQLAAMSRADVTIDKRTDCFLYVDEFQNFATDSFAVILSEARKYNLCLMMANQYIEQMPEEVRNAVFGNAGTIVTFRVGGTDATFLVKEFEPIFDQNDLVNLDKYSVYIKLLVNGISSPAFSAGTLPPVQKLSGNIEKVIDYSRQHYSNARSAVENQIADRTRQEEVEMKKEAELFKQGGLQALLTQKGATISEGSFSSIKKNNGDGGEGFARDQGRRPKAEGPRPKDDLGQETQNTEDEARSTEPREQNTENGAEKMEQTRENGGSMARLEPEISDMEAGESENKKKRYSRIFRYQNIVGDKIYKEQTARGGVKWYVGDAIDEERIAKEGLSLDENARKMIKLAVRAVSGSAAATKNKAPKSDPPKESAPKEGSQTEPQTAASVSGAQVLNQDAPIEIDQSMQAPVHPKINSTSDSGNEVMSGDLSEGEEVKIP